MRENWYALFIAIKLKVTVEQAFKIFEDGSLKKSKLITEEDEKDMIAMKKQGITYKEIGMIYGVTDSTVCHKIKPKMEMIV